MIETLATLSWLEWLGYIASMIIAFSMTLGSIVKFRIVNLIGAASFAAYGFIIGAYPVGALNVFIVVVDIYYLIKIFGRKDDFELLEVRPDNQYLIKFLNFHQQEIRNFFPHFSYNSEQTDISFFVLRNTTVAGLFLGQKNGDGTLKVALDYVAPAYRDFKNGRFVFVHLNETLIHQGISRVMADGSSPQHAKYLRSIGFQKTKENTFEKKLRE
jgi:hypothetical protein